MPAGRQWGYFRRGKDIHSSYIVRVLYLFSCVLVYLEREMLARSGYEPRPSKPVGRPAQTSTNIGRLNTRHNQHWPNRSNSQRRCRVCSARGVKRCVVSMCWVWRDALCGPWLFYGLPHKGQIIRHLFIRPPCKELKPRPQCK